MIWRALTIRPPWSWAVATGVKVTENRSGSPSRWRYRGPLMVHAGAQWSTRGAQDPRVLNLWRNVYRGDIAPNLGVRNIPTITRPGQIVAVCDLVDAHTAWGCCAPWGEDSYTDAAGVHRTDITHLTLENIRPVYVPATAGPDVSLAVRGRLGLWTPPPDLATLVESVLEYQEVTP